MSLTKLNLDGVWEKAAVEWSEMHNSSPTESWMVPGSLVLELEKYIRRDGPEMASFMLAYFALMIWVKHKSGEELPENWKPLT